MKRVPNCTSVPHFLDVRRFPCILSIILCLVVGWSIPAPASSLAQSSLAGEKFAIGFSPNGESLNIILQQINGAQQSIFIAAYSFTSKPISQALSEAHKRGVEVMLIADAKSNSGKFSAVPYLVSQSIPVRKNHHYSIFHHKFMVIDGRHLQTGSFNFSAAAATKNAENVIVLLDVPEICGIYMQEWQRLWNESDDVLPTAN